MSPERKRNFKPAIQVPYSRTPTRSRSTGGSFVGKIYLCGSAYRNNSKWEKENYYMFVLDQKTGTFSPFQLFLVRRNVTDVNTYASRGCRWTCASSADYSLIGCRWRPQATNVSLCSPHPRHFLSSFAVPVSARRGYWDSTPHAGKQWLPLARPACTELYIHCNEDFASFSALTSHPAGTLIYHHVVTEFHHLSATTIDSIVQVHCAMEK